jgi:hypothetical protein
MSRNLTYTLTSSWLETRLWRRVEFRTWKVSWLGIGLFAKTWRIPTGKETIMSPVIFTWHLNKQFKVKLKSKSVESWNWERKVPELTGSHHFPWSRHGRFRGRLRRGESSLTSRSWVGTDPGTHPRNSQRSGCPGSRCSRPEKSRERGNSRFSIQYRDVIVIMLCFDTRQGYMHRVRTSGLFFLDYGHLKHDFLNYYILASKHF